MFFNLVLDLIIMVSNSGSLEIYTWLVFIFNQDLVVSNNVLCVAIVKVGMPIVILKLLHLSSNMVG